MVNLRILAFSLLVSYWRKCTIILPYLIIHREKTVRTTTNVIAERDAPYRPVCRFCESPAKMYQYNSILDLWGNLRKTGVTIALFILPMISLLALKSVGSNCVRVKEGMLLLAANPRNTPPSKAVRKYVLYTFLAVF